MSVDLNRLTAHLSPKQQDDVKQAYHRGAEHSTTAFLYCFFLGTLGAHRFYLRQWRKGFAHLIVLLALAAVLVAGVALTWSPLVVIAVVIPLAIIALTWEIIDLFTIDHEVYEHNLKLVERLIGTSLLSDHTVERGADAKLENMLSGAEAHATSAARHDQTVADAVSAGALAQETAAAAEPVPALQPAAADAVADERVDTRQDASAALATDEYVATTTTQISGDDPAETQHASEQPSSWSETERYHAGEALAGGEAASIEEMERDGGGDLAAASVTDSVATGDDISLDQSLTRSHEASDYSVTDSAELMTTMAAADSRREDEQAVAEEETPLTTQEAEAVTWPDHDLVAFDEPVADSSSVASETEAAAGGGAEDAALLGVGGAALAGAGLLFAETRGPSSGPDATDSSQHPGSVETIADVEGADATPLYVTLPPQAPAEREYFDSTDRAVGADDLAGGGSAGELDDGLVVFVPEMDEPSGAMPALDEYPTESPVSSEPPAEAYIPPTVPVISSFDAAPSQSGSYRSVYDGTLGDSTAESSEESPSTSVAPDESQKQPSGFETLAELAGGAALGAGAASAYEGYARREEPAEEAQVAAPEAAQMSEAIAPLAEAAPLAAEDASPAQESTPQAMTGLDAEPVLPAATAATVSEQAATTPDDSHHRMRHIRVVRQTVVGGEIIEETAAEEYIDEDADPEPVRARLRTMLEQQGGGRIADASTPGGE